MGCGIRRIPGALLQVPTMAPHRCSAGFEQHVQRKEQVRPGKHCYIKLRHMYRRMGLAYKVPIRQANEHGTRPKKDCKAAVSRSSSSNQQGCEPNYHLQVSNSSACHSQDNIMCIQSPPQSPAF